MRRLTFIAFMLTALALGAKAQSTLTGKVIDETETELPFVNVALLKANDSTLVSGTITGEDGVYVIATATTKDLMIRLSSVGYQTTYINDLKPEMGTVKLEPESTIMGEVTVKSTLPKTIIKGDALITNVQGSVLEKSGKATDLLSLVPGVQCEDGTPSVFGRGEAEVYINGRKMRDQNELTSLTSDMIKSVEVVRNPGSRYAADVKAVIRIITKKAVGEGWSFSDEMEWYYQYSRSLSNDLHATYRTGAWEINGEISTDNSIWENETSNILTTAIEDTWEQVGSIHNKKIRKDLAPTLSINFNPNENHSAGVRYHYYHIPNGEMEGVMDTEVFKNGLLEETNTSIPLGESDSWDHTLNGYYNCKAGDWSVDFNADFYYGDTELTTETTESVTLPGDMTKEKHVSKVHTTSTNDNKMFATKLVFSHPALGGNLAFGGETSNVKRNNGYINPENVVKDDLSHIDEDIIAAFAEYSRVIDKVNLSAGLRYEHSKTKYYEFDKLIDEQSKEYNDLFPSASLSTQIGQKSFLSLSYSYKIRRPQFSNLTSNIIYINKYSLQGGNPKLRPYYSHDISLSFARGWFTFMGEYQHIRNEIILSTGKYGNDPKIMFIRPENAPEYNNYGVSLILQPHAGMWHAQMVANTRIQDYVADTYDGKRKFDKPIYYFGSYNTFTLPKSWRIEVNAYIQTKGEYQNVEMLDASSCIKANILKTFLNDNIQLRFTANDITKSRTNHIRINYGKQCLEQDLEAKTSYSVIATFKFNTARSKYKGQGAGQDTMSRIK